MSKSQAISVAGVRLRVIQLVAVCLTTGCTAVPDKPASNEYSIPVVKSDDSFEQFTVERIPGDTETMLFCIESPDATGVLCASRQGDKARRYVMPMPEAEGREIEPQESDREGI